ncbi:brachyurin-like [Anopheles marshallii]|uniref:brachyurin-like n=1 Tax=Anopheles marshallii TaxID=1521116 RepID=UPI00237B8742|nr:brachyurin-like [Anopheles marshallii]XP_053666485.1 brachyurin-like [Anopheles marshallii]
MKTFVLLVALFAVASAEWIDIDWSKVRPIEEFDHYWERLPPEMQIYRKMLPTQRIVNGQEATPGQFPYQIALLSTFPTGTGLCGGSVLTNNFILSAAHCVISSGTTLASGGTAIIGAHDRTIQEPSQQRIAFTAAGIIPHPGYTSTNLRNDIAVVRLNSPIVYTNRIQPTRLPGRSDTRQFGGMIGTVSGFGRTTDTGSTSPVIRYTSNPVMTNADCNVHWSTTQVQAQNVCQTTDGGRSSCNGDSGGPLTVQDGGRSLQIGLVSFGSAASGCSGPMPKVFVRVSFFLDWIQANSDFVAAP